MSAGLLNKHGRSRTMSAVFHAALMLLNGILIGAAGAATSYAAELSPHELSQHDMALLDRLSWGINASSAAHMQAIGAERWLSEQLHPVSGALPASAQAQIEAMPDVHKFPFDIAVAFDQQAKAANQTA